MNTDTYPKTISYSYQVDTCQSLIRCLI